MSRAATGTKIKIISSFDAEFSDPSFSKRIASGDISVARLQDNEVELKIAELKPQDAGVYFCATPSTDAVISGNYDAQVQLTGKEKFMLIYLSPDWVKLCLTVLLKAALLVHLTAIFMI